MNDFVKFIKKVLITNYKIFKYFIINKKIKISSNIPKEVFPLPHINKNSIKLNIGGGKGHPYLDGWKIVDIRKNADYIVDISKEKLPFNDNSVDIIFTSHTLEHIFPQSLEFILKEMLRVLKPRHLLRIIVPDIKKGINAYFNEDYDFFANSKVSTFNKNLPLGGMLACWFYSTNDFKDLKKHISNGHVHCFDTDYLSWWLKKVGFSYIWESSFKGSVLDELRQEGFDLNENDSLFIEAIK